MVFLSLSSKIISFLCINNKATLIIAKNRPNNIRMMLFGINNSPAIPIKHKILTRNSLSCFIFAHPSSLESFHRMYLALNTRIASHGCKSEIVSSHDNKIVLQHGNINYLVLHFHHFTSITITATTKTAINSTNDISFRTIFRLKKKSTTNRTARATNSKAPIILLMILFLSMFLYDS